MQEPEITGVAADMPNADYHAHRAIGSSGIKLLARSPLHYWAAYVDPDRPADKPTRYMRRGTAWHAAVFEPDNFSRLYAPKPSVHPTSTVGIAVADFLSDPEAFHETYVPIPVSKACKEGKALVAEIEAAGKIAIEQEKYDEARRIALPLAGLELINLVDLDNATEAARIARAHPVMRVILSQPGGMAETSIFFTDPVTGLQCKIRPDYCVPPCQLFPNGLIVDGKSTVDASPDGFPRQCWSYEMPLQAAFYVDGFQLHYRTKEPPAFIWLAQEQVRPYAAMPHSAPADLLAYGRREYRRLLGVYQECTRSNTWPGYPQRVQPLQLPAWAQKIVNDSIAAA